MRTVFSGGRLFDGETLQDGLAVIVDGASVTGVVPVAEAPELTSPDEGQHIDTTACTILPGLIDCHVHLLYGAEGNPGSVVEGMAEAAVAVRGLENARASL
ncbi:MAG: amidohydrolase family protein, partial [Pseudomonadota bacterium]